MNRSLALRVLTALALIGVAVVHLDIAGDYVPLGKHPLSLGDQFRAQGVIAILLAIALMVKPHLLVWLAAAGFAAGSLAVLVYSRYKTIPIYGLPGGFTETWEAKGAKPAAYFESAALLLALIGSALSFGQFRQARSS
ncbi:MAG: Membrane protein [Frankiales bacterium]|nr:Membrane protein [Frankiales bacterium]